METPRKAFRAITLAEHKNYVSFLYSLFGISLSFTAFWFLRLGRYFETLLDLIPWAFGVGIVLGLVSAIVLSGAYHLLARLLGGSSSYRNSVAVVGYSLTPILLSLFVVLPIELLTYGMHFFTWNPDPYSLNPVSYIILIGLDVLVALWSIALAVVGTRLSHQLSTAKSLFVVTGTATAFLLAAFLASRPLSPIAGL